MSHEEVKSSPEQSVFDLRYITSTEIGDRLNVTRPTLFNYRRNGKLPSAISVNDGRLFVWDRDYIEPFIRAIENQK